MRFGRGVTDSQNDSDIRKQTCGSGGAVALHRLLVGIVDQASMIAPTSAGLRVSLAFPFHSSLRLSLSTLFAPSV